MEINIFFLQYSAVIKMIMMTLYIYIYIYNLFINIENIYIYLKIENNKKYILTKLTE